MVSPSREPKATAAPRFTTAMPYRDELEALRSREEALTRELDETRQMRRAAERRALPLLDTLRVASPCPEKWENMVGDATRRFCGRCAKNVYDLSAMTREEAERFVLGAVGPVCVTMRKRSDGTVITGDCPAGVRRKRVRRGALAVVVSGAAAAAALLPAEEASSPCADAPQRAAEHRELTPKEEAVDRLDAVGRSNRYDAITGLVAAPEKSGKKTARTTGCLCAPGDPLCSCL
jgi:hypothetical protein